MRTITFDSVSLTDTNIVTKEVQFEDVSNRHINYQKITNRDGSKFVDDEYNIKTITLTGVIKDSTSALLDDRIDDVKELLSRQEKNLDIEYISGTRRFIASCTRFDTARDHYHLTYVPFTITFAVSNPPFGKDLDTTTGSWDGLNDASATTITLDTGEKSINFGGTRRPLPKLQFTINSCLGLRNIKFTNNDNGDWIAVTKVHYQDGDALIIDCDALTVKINGTEVDYTGVFPQFVVGWNDFKVEFEGESYNADLDIIYYRLWL